ncbi:MAG: UvrD-helicase domain-containing protein, partial [Pseudomonadota bacterium]|nr:UvrD-helicase domain-containing protein [Pseudomonadota bacterium]
QLAGQKGLYLAFNKAIADDARSKFPSNVDCRTFHSLAYRHVDRQITDKLRLPRLSPLALARDYQLEPISLRRMLGKRYEHFTLTPSRQAGLISNAVSRFCATHARHPAPRHLDLPDWLHPDDADELQQHLFPHVERRWIDALDPRHRAGINHEVYLKRWALSDPIIPVDYILFDEAQDSDPLMLGILMAQTRAQVIYVGDAHQQIYQWRGAVNAMQKLPLPDTRLTRSFRFGQAVADVANTFLKELGETTPLQGMPHLDSSIDLSPIMRHKDAVLCRTNARAMSLLMGGLVQGHKVALQADSERLIKFVQAAAALKAGKRVFDVPELSWFNSWQEVHEYCETSDSSDIKPLVKLVDEHGTEPLKKALDQISPIESADYVISTAHKAKGLEWQRVQIEDDYSYKLTKGNVQISPEELRLLYVATTRAQSILNVHHLQPLIGTLRAQHNKKAKLIATPE